MSIRALIIDDDPFIQDLLRDKIDQYIQDVNIVDTASSGSDGLETISRHNPDLVFLDVEMSDMTGFEMLSQLEKINFQTIFITSFNHYAIKAIRFNALDYLVKPIDLGELRTAMDRYREMAQATGASNNVHQAISNMKATNPGEEVLTLHLQDRELRMQLKEIVRIEGERNYSTIYSSHGEKSLSSKTLAYFEEMLEEKGFFRCHKSHLVNGEHISGVQKSGILILSDDSEVNVARRKMEAFKEWYGKWGGS